MRDTGSQIVHVWFLILLLLILEIKYRFYELLIRLSYYI